LATRKQPEINPKDNIVSLKPDKMFKGGGGVAKYNIFGGPSLPPYPPMKPPLLASVSAL